MLATAQLHDNTIDIWTRPSHEKLTYPLPESAEILRLCMRKRCSILGSFSSFYNLQLVCITKDRVLFHLGCIHRGQGFRDKTHDTGMDI